MHVPRDLLDDKLMALERVLPALLADTSAEQYLAEFAKLEDELFQQCMPEDKDYALAKLVEKGWLASDWGVIVDPVGGFGERN